MEDPIMKKQISILSLVLALLMLAA